MERWHGKPGGGSRVNAASSTRALALALMASQLGFAQPARAAEGIDEVRECVERNLPKESVVQDIQLVSRDRSGQERVYEGKFYGKRAAGEDFNVLLRLEKPLDLRGSSYLLLRKGDDTDVFVYLPELRRVRRITTRTIAGSLFGTEFSYEDFERLQDVAEASSSERLPDAKQGERDAYVVAVVPEQGLRLRVHPDRRVRGQEDVRPAADRVLRGRGRAEQAADPRSCAASRRLRRPGFRNGWS